MGSKGPVKLKSPKSHIQKVKEALLRGWTVGGKFWAEAATWADWNGSRLNCRKSGKMLSFICDGINN